MFINPQDVEYARERLASFRREADENRSVPRTVKQPSLLLWRRVRITIAVQLIPAQAPQCEPSRLTAECS